MMRKVYLLNVIIYIVWGIAATKFESNRCKIATCAAVQPICFRKITQKWLIFSEYLVSA